VDVSCFCCAAAHGGQVACEETLVQRVIHAWSNGNGAPTGSSPSHVGGTGPPSAAQNTTDGDAGSSSRHHPHADSSQTPGSVCIHVNPDAVDATGQAAGTSGHQQHGLSLPLPLQRSLASVPSLDNRLRQHPSQTSLPPHPEGDETSTQTPPRLCGGGDSSPELSKPETPDALEAPVETESAAGTGSVEGSVTERPGVTRLRLPSQLLYQVPPHNGSIRMSRLAMTSSTSPIEAVSPADTCNNPSHPVITVVGLQPANGRAAAEEDGEASPGTLTPTAAPSLAGVICHHLGTFK
jgi:hypothetical protein